MTSQVDAVTFKAQEIERIEARIVDAARKCQLINTLSPVLKVALWDLRCAEDELELLSDDA